MARRVDEEAYNEGVDEICVRRDGESLPGSLCRQYFQLVALQYKHRGAHAAFRDAVLYIGAGIVVAPFVAIFSLAGGFSKPNP